MEQMPPVQVVGVHCVTTPANGLPMVLVMMEAQTQTTLFVLSAQTAPTVAPEVPVKTHVPPQTMAHAMTMVLVEAVVVTGAPTVQTVVPTESFNEIHLPLA